MTRPYTLLSCCISLDGYLGGPTERRLVLSNDADLDRVDGTRAGCDAILVGAATVRTDDPRLQVRSLALRRDRVARGLPEQPVKVTLTRRGCLDPGAAFFTVGTAPRLVYCPPGAAPRTRARLAAVADGVEVVEVVEVAGPATDPVHDGPVGDGPADDGTGGPDEHAPVCLRSVGEDLYRRGVRRLMVEGGGTVLTQFLGDGLADELQLTVAPFFVGDARATRFVGERRFPWHPGNRAHLADVRRVGDVALLRYALSDRFDEASRPPGSGVTGAAAAAAPAAPGRRRAGPPPASS